MISNSKYFILLIILICNLSCNQETDLNKCIELKKRERIEKIEVNNNEVIEFLKKKELEFMSFINSNDSLKHIWQNLNPEISKDTISVAIMNKRFYYPFAQGNKMSVYSTINMNRISTRKMFDSWFDIYKIHKSLISETDCEHISSNEGMTNILGHDYWDKLEVMAAQYDMLLELEKCK